MAPSATRTPDLPSGAEPGGLAGAATATSSPSPTPTATPARTPLSIAVAPGNDDFGSATAIGQLPFFTTQDTAEATTVADDPSMGAGVGANSHTLWFGFAARANDTLRASTAGSSYDTVLAVFTGSRGALTLVAGNDGFGGTVQSQITFGVQAGVSYFLEVASYSSTAGGALTLSVEAGVPTPTPTSTPTSTPSPTPSATPSPVPASTATAMATITPVATATPVVTNDDFDSATLVGSLPFVATLDTSEATVAAEDPDMGVGAGVNSHTVWYRFVARAGDVLQVSTLGSDYDTVLVAYTGSRGALTPVAVGDDFDGTLQSRITFDVQVGVPYSLEIASFGDTPGGTLLLVVESTLSAPTPPATTTPTQAATPTGTPPPTSTPTVPPANDEFDTATLVDGLPFFTTQDTTGATVAAGDPDMGAGTGVNSNTVWFRFVAPADGTLQVSTLGSDYDTVLAAFSESRAGLSLAGSGDDFGGTLQSQISLGVQAGVTYFLEVAGYGGSSGGTLTLSVEAPLPTSTPTPPAAAPTNDDFAAPKDVSRLPYGDPTDTTGATVAADDPSMGAGSDPNSHTVWFRYVAPANDTLLASTFGSSFDTVLAAFTGSRGALTPVAANDDADDTLQSQIVFDVQAGTTYFVEVASYGDTPGGALRFSVEGGLPMSAPTATVGPTLTPTATPTPQPAPREQRIPLHEGWNWFSFAVDPGVLSPAEVLVSLAGQYDYVLGEAGTHAASPPYPGANTLATLEPGRGYFLRMTQPAVLVLQGPSLAAGTPMPLTPGWHWIGYLPAAGQDLPGALSSISGRFDYVLGEYGTYAVSPPYPGANTLSGMEPGRGYLIRMREDGTLTYSSQ